MRPDAPPQSVHPARASAVRRCSLPSLLALGLFVLTAAGPAAAGNLVSARCACGFTIERLPLFGGRADYKRMCRFPGLCLATGRIVLFNTLDPTARPKGCPVGPVISYAAPALAPSPSGEELVSWRVSSRGLTLRLYRGGYYCPRCHRKTLHFSLVGFFD